MNRTNFDKIFMDVSYALGKAENKHPDFCTSLLDENFDKDINYNLLKIARDINNKNEKQKKESVEGVLLEEVYELFEASANKDLNAVYSEALDVAVVALRTMEYALKHGANVEKV